MTETELLKHLKELKQIKPNSEWVALTKSRIFIGAENLEFVQPSVRPAAMSLRNMLSVFNIFHPSWRPIAAPIISFAVLFGIFSFAQVTVPGDLLYPIKRAAEATQINLAAEDQKPKIHLEFANKRLEESISIAQSGKIKTLNQSAITEFQANINEAAKNLSSIKEPQNHPGIVKDVIVQAKKIKENKARLEAVLADTDDGKLVQLDQLDQLVQLDNALAELTEKEIQALEKRILTEEQENDFADIKKDYEAGDYGSALEKLLLINNNQ